MNIQPMSPIAQHVFLRTYAQYLPDEKRYETYPEAIERLLGSFIRKTRPLVTRKAMLLVAAELTRLRPYLEAREVMPSMRALAMAGNGRAWEKNDITGYNCAYLEADSSRALASALLVLMCGTGVGFSVESRCTDKLPVIPGTLHQPEAPPLVTVADSREGWAKALLQFMNYLWEGVIPSWDLSQVRAHGEVLKTTGGTASGPSPLDWLFKEYVKVFVAAKGRRLRPAEVQGLICRQGQIVVMGNVRRSALIALGDLDSQEMREFKNTEVHGNWFGGAEDWRGRSNNSAVYEGEFNQRLFDIEFDQMITSQTGERGIFNRDGVLALAPERRRTRGLFSELLPGTNPCGEVHLATNQCCNLTDVMLSPADSREWMILKVRAAAFLGTLQSQFTRFGYLTELDQRWEEHTNAERLLGVSLSGICSSPLVLLPRSERNEILAELKHAVIDTNVYWAGVLGIPISMATTVIKPSGTASLVADRPPGIHAYHAPHYMRRVRVSSEHPLVELVEEQGWPHSWLDGLCVVDFPCKAPEGSVVGGGEGNGVTEQLERCLDVQSHYCEGSVSCTISIEKHERGLTKDWVKKHFGRLSALSFMNADNQEGDEGKTGRGMKYELPPLEAITKDDYESRAAALPQINWDRLKPPSAPKDEVAAGDCTGQSCEWV